MSEENVVRLCAPTLAGIKTGSLFPCPFENRETLLMEIRQYNQVLVPKGLCLLPLRFTDKSALLYLYRPRDLERDLQDRLAAEILQHAGYVCGSSEQCLMKLIERLRAYDEFPHEIGLFLSYPPEDVKGFIEHHAADFSMPASGRCTATSSGRATSLQNTSGVRRSTANVCTRARALRSSP